MNDTFKIAQSSYQTWDSVVQVYQRFSDNAKTLGINMEQTAKLTETVSKAVAVSGASTQAAEAALTQFGQALASGTLRGEELNSILEQTPALAKAIAQGMGITVGQLRSVAAEGKITGDVLVDALTKSADSVEQLFQKTDITISQSIGLLSNELTKFIGEAGQSSGAASILAESVKLLAQNLSLLADAAVVGGIGYITKAILTKTVAVQGAIAASVAQKAADAAEAQASIAVATTKVNEAKAHLANVQATNAETQAKYGAAAANARYKLASDAVTQSIIAQNAAQGALNTSMSVGSRALALVGGPIGAITLGVSALAAGYMYLQNRTAEANAKLEEQGKIANKTNEELKKLAGNDKVSAVNDLTAAFNDQNEKLAKSKESIDAVLFAIRAASVENERARKITEDARNGVISYTDAIKLLNNEKIPVDLYNRLKEQADQYDENSNKAANTQRALAALKVEVKLAGNASQNAAAQHRDQEAALNGVEGAARGAANALSEYAAQALQSGKRAQITNTLLSKGYSLDVARDLADIAAKNGKVTREEAAAILYKSKQEEALKANIQARSKVESTASKARSSATKSQAKEQRAAVKEAERAAQERLQIEYQYADDLKKGYLDLDAEIKRIIESGADSSFIQKAKDRHNFEEELYLRSLTEQINAYKWSEEEKLKYSIETQKLIANESGKYNDDHKQAVLESLDAQRDYELAQIKLAKETRMFQMKEAFLSETDAMNQRYALEEKRIMQINDVEEREFALKINRLKQEEEQRKRIQSAQTNMGNIQAQNSGTSDFVNIETTRFDQIAASDELFQAQLAANFEAREQLWREHEERVTEINRAADAARLDLQMNYGQQITGSFADLFKTIAGEQSNGYKLMFTAQKAFAIAQSMIAIQQGIAQAAALPFPLNLGAMATVAAQTASIVANIKAVREGGFKDGGYTGNISKSQVAGVVHGQEYVLNAEATKRVGRGTLDALNNGGTLESSGSVNVIINVPQGYKAVQTQSENGVTIDIVENMINQSWGNVNRPNSNESRAIQGAFGIAPKR
jgi:tape measure domain-containing protein